MPGEADRIEDDVQQPIAEEPQKLTIDVSDPDPDDDEGEGKAAASPELDRRGRRAHYRELKRDHEDLKSKYEALERRISEGQQRQQQQEPARPSDPPGLAPIRARLSELESIEDALMAQASTANLTPEQAKEVNRRYRAVKREEQALIADGRDIVRRHQQPQVDHQRDAVGAVLRSEFPEIYSDEGLSGLAQYHFKRLVQSGKDPSDIETSREALRRTRTAAGTGPRPAPPASEKARFASVSARAGANGGSQSGSWQPHQGHVRTAREWAKAKGLDVDDKEALRQWAQKVGKPAKLI